MKNKLTFGILMTMALSLMLAGCSKNAPAQLEDKQVDVQETVIDSAEAYASDGDNSGTEAVATATTVEKGSDTDVAKADASNTDVTDTDASNADVADASDTARTDDANKSDNDELSAYADFLSNYMSHPVVSTLMEDAFGGEEDDNPADAESVYSTLIYVNDDDTIELALTNGACPWNPVHLFTYEDGEVRQVGEYSMYGMMYYAPKSGHILPMYYPPAGEAEINLFDSDETITLDMDKEFGNYLPVADYNSTCLAKVNDFEQELVQLKKTAPIGVTPLGAPIIDDSYLTEGEVTFEGKHAEQIPGIWYLQTDDDIEITWIEFDTNGTFTTHNIYNETNVGYIKYEEESPLLEDGGIYYLYNSDGTRYDSFEIGPVEDYGYIMNFFGRVYFKHPETWKD